jgi:hypothetical protein
MGVTWEKRSFTTDNVISYMSNGHQPKSDMYLTTLSSSCNYKCVESIAFAVVVIHNMSRFEQVTF